MSERLGTGSPAYVGIDVGAERLHCVALDAHTHIAGATVYAATELEQLVAWAAPATTVAIDAPSELSTAPHKDAPTFSGKFRVARCAEIALGREFGCWVPWVTPTAPPVAGWMTTGFALYDALRAAGKNPIETYPYAAYRELTRPAPLPKKQTLAGARARVAALRAAGVSARDLELWSHDALDALVGAVVARDHARKTARAATCGHDASAIWLPAPADVPRQASEQPSTNLNHLRGG